MVNVAAREQAIACDEHTRDGLVCREHVEPGEVANARIERAVVADRILAAHAVRRAQDLIVLAERGREMHHARAVRGRHPVGGKHRRAG